MADVLPVHGHAELQERLRGAVRQGRLPQSLLLHGPEGVGKQRLALWIAALLECEEAGPCGRCRSCRLAARLEHPDIHWHFPLPRPKRASTRAKEREKLEEARLERIARWREDPLAPPEAEGPTGIYLAAVEEIRAQASRRPAMGRRAVFVVGEAEAMVPQAANREAANAFLKLLEEPAPYLHLILTSARPRSLLATIRSRTLAVRVPPLPAAEVERFLTARTEVGGREAARLASLSQGSIGRALRLASGAGAEERKQAEAFLAAALTGDRAARLRLAATVGGRGARGAFSDMLEGLEALLRDVAAASSGRPELAWDPEALGRVSPRSGGAPDPRGVVRAMDRLQDARRAAAGNANPQAVTAVLLADLQRSLRRRR